jgi:hypothetical protein
VEQVAADFLELPSKVEHHYPDLSIAVCAASGQKHGAHFRWLTETSARHSKVNF